eukprot:CAMPEP_0197032660 /NCGR_PEP_ID=MMETSP1384-20130603/11273_1 /TAXON_ID=29189 /ORGANISM="Ammonia sp." /LENGTH=320 /DNA_ID=CAMNT_0042462353 /DNA_START=90 /DNA_END=1052 /DNA_ORIENTATION=-
MAEEKQQNNDDKYPYRVDIVKLFDYAVTDDNLAYFIIDRESSECMVVDPAVCEPPIMKRYNELKQELPELKLVGVLTTHKHHDHSAGNGQMRAKFKDLRVYGGKADNIKEYLNDNVFTDEVVEGDVLKLGKNTKISVFDVPCHTVGHVLYYVTDPQDKYGSLITGDTLFVGGVGHFFEGTAQAMLDNFRKIAKFPKDTRVYAGHEYALSNYEFGVFIDPDNEKLQQRYQYAKQQKAAGGLCMPSTIEIELESNVFMKSGDKTVQENLKKHWNAAGKAVIGKVGQRHAVAVGDDTAKWTEADVIGGLRHLKTTGYHKNAKI